MVRAEKAEAVERWKALSTSCPASAETIITPFFS
jgi:hypothetical protein